MKKCLNYLVMILSIFLVLKNNVYATTYLEKDIPVNSYVIGTHLYTREKNENYDGTLTTEYIMLGSDTINSQDINDMIIYYKNPRGEWYNELTEEKVDVGTEFEITHKDTIISISTPVLAAKNISYTNEGIVGTIYLRNTSDYENYPITGFELYTSEPNQNTNNTFELDGVKYYLLSTVKDTYEYQGVIPGGIASKGYTQIARAFIENEDGTKIYSNYSETIRVVMDSINNVMVTTEEKPEKPNISYILETTNGPEGSVCETNDLCKKITMNIEYNQYFDENNNYNINGIEIYQKDLSGSVSINGEKYSQTASLSYEDGITTEDFGDDLPYILPIEVAVRVYVFDKNGEKVYSEPTFITVDSDEKYMYDIYKDQLDNTLGSLAYTISDINGDGTPELILRGPFGGTSMPNAYQIITYYNDTTYLVKNYESDKSYVSLDHYKYKVYQNNDNTLKFVSSFKNSSFVQLVNTVTMTGDDKLTENIEEKNINSLDDLLVGDKLLEFYSLNDKKHLNSEVTNVAIKNKYEDLINTYIDAYKYALTDIDGDGMYELIIKTLTGKDFIQVYTVFGNQIDYNLNIMHKHYIASPSNSDLFAPYEAEQYLYQNSDNTLTFVSKELYQEKENISIYELTDVVDFPVPKVLSLTNYNQQDIIDGEMTKGDKLIIFKNYFPN